MGYQDVFQCVGIFVRIFADGNFCDVLLVVVVVGDLYCFPCV